MGIIEQARKDIAQITQNGNDFAIDLVFTSPEGDVANIKGLHTRHHLGINDQGLPVNSRNVHVSISETAFTDAEYPFRNDQDEVDLKNHRVDAKDSSGITRTYIVNQWHQDETVGLVVCILGDYE